MEHNFNTRVRNTLKCHMQSTRDTVWRDHVESLTVQGNTLALAVAEKCDEVRSWSISSNGRPYQESGTYDC